MATVDDLTRLARLDAAQYLAQLATELATGCDEGSADACRSLVVALGEAKTALADVAGVGSAEAFDDQSSAILRTLFCLSDRSEWVTTWIGRRMREVRRNHPTPAWRKPFPVVGVVVVDTAEGAL